MKKDKLEVGDNFLIGEELLLDINNELRLYAKENKFKLTKNFHAWPERSLSWNSKGLNKQIQIYLEKDGKDFMIWCSAYKDTIFGKRYFWSQEPRNIKLNAGWQVIKMELENLTVRLGKIEKSDLNLINRNSKLIPVIPR